MPKRLYLSDEWNHSGIDITWTPSAQRLDVGGWYDSFVGLETHCLTLCQFFDELGITEKDCAKAFKQASGGIAQ
tara:strand:- start:20 stop:241 length:222 start_codon:yes stop_codon:yes gene_type:complete